MTEMSDLCYLRKPRSITINFSALSSLLEMDASIKVSIQSQALIFSCLRIQAVRQVRVWLSHFKDSSSTSGKGMAFSF